MSDLRFPEWEEALKDALLELDPNKLHQKVVAAEVAIFKRLQELSNNTDHHEERLALNDATSSLRVLKVEQLKFPDWDSK